MNLLIRYVPSGISSPWSDDSTDVRQLVWGTTDVTRKFGKFAATEWDLSQYDAVMLADDDVTPIACTVAGMFDVFAQSGARVGHPALTRDSPHAFTHSLQAQDWHVPYSAVPFTELMCPMFTRDALLEYRPHFAETVHGWGLEQLIAHRERAAGRTVVRLDATPMRHLRPLGGSYDHEVAMGEARTFLSRHAVPLPEHMQ